MRSDLQLTDIEKSNSQTELAAAVTQADFIFHLAGVNRPTDPAEFAVGNRDLTTKLAEFVCATGRSIPFVISSSIQAERDNPYGLSKLGAGEALLAKNPLLIGGVHILSPAKCM